MGVSLKKRVQFYHTLATMEEAGVSRISMLEQRFPGAFRAAAIRLRSGIQIDGLDLAEAMRRDPAIFSQMEHSLVAVGEHTGSLDVVFKALGDWFQIVARLRSKMISGLLYPALTYHFAAIAIPFISIFTSETTVASAVLRACILLGLPWALYVLTTCFSGILSAPTVGWLLLQVPFLGSFLQRLDCTRFFHAYSLCLRAGVSAPQAIQLSGACCKNGTMQQRFHAIQGTVASEGIPFTEAFMAIMPGSGRNSMIGALMETGEQSGRTDESAARIARVFQEETETALERIAAILPTLIYLALAVYIAVQIFSFYSQLLAPMRELLE